MVDGYNYQVGYAYPSPSVGYSTYSPFNRNAGTVTQAPYTPNPYGSGDTFQASNTNFDIDGVSQNISDNIKRITAGFGLPQNNSVPTGQPNVPQADIQWALQLEEKVQKQGYQPTQEEVAKYQSIADRLTNKQPSTPAPTTQSQSSTASNVPQAEIQWALQLEEKVQKQGYQPTQEEMARYQSIADKLTNKQPTTPAPTTQPNMPSNVSQAEIQWALQLEEKVQKQGYQPTQEEMAKYQDIANRITAATPQNNSQPVKTNTNWVEWSKPLDVPAMPSMTANAVSNNYGRMVPVPATLRPMNITVQPTPTVNVPVINQQVTVVPAQMPQTMNTSKIGLVTQPEINWALALEDKVQKQGYNPTPQELNQYNEIANKLAAAQGISISPVPTTVPIQQVTVQSPAINTLNGPITVQPTFPQQNQNYGYVNSNQVIMNQPQNQPPSFFQKVKNGLNAFWGAMK